MEVQYLMQSTIAAAGKRLATAFPHLSTAVVAALFFPLLATRAPAQTDIYVSIGSGADTNAGTTLSPVKHIAVGLTKVADGGTVHIDGGVYQENLTISHTVTLKGSSKTPGVVIDGHQAGRTVVIGDGVTATLDHLTVTGAYTNLGAGGVLDQGYLTMTNCTVAGNRADGFYGGGGLWVGGSVFGRTANLTNVTICDNNGGGITVDGGSLTLVNCTISNNTGFGSNGAGIFLDVPQSGMSAVNTIVAKNTPVDCRNGGVVVSNGYNLDGDGTCGFKSAGDIHGVDPKLGPLQDNGGACSTRALLAGSPAIDAGTNALCPPTDERGDPRPFDGLGAGIPVCDIGAFEDTQVQKYTVNDVRRALGIWLGADTAVAGDIARLDLEAAGDIVQVINAKDIARIMRKVAGLETNP